MDIGDGLKLNSMAVDIVHYRKDYSYLLKRILTHQFFSKPSKPDVIIPEAFSGSREYTDFYIPLFVRECLANLEQQLSSVSRHLFALKASEWKLEFVRDENNGLVLYDVESNQADEILHLSNCIVLIAPSREKNNVLKINRPIEDFMILGVTCDNNLKNRKQLLIAEEFDKLIKKHYKLGPLIVWKLDKVITHIREFLAIKNIEFDFMAEFLYQPKSSLKKFEVKHDYESFHRFFNSIKDMYNHSQFSSIQNICLMKQGIKLLQGPPGTGKTHTLIGVVSGIYHYIKTESTNCRKHILICAPSNYAVDEIILRIIHRGIFDQAGARVVPKVVRLGVTDKSKSDDIKRVTAEFLAEKEVRKQRGKAAPPPGLQVASRSPQNGKLLSELRNELEDIDEQLRFLVESGKGDSTDYLAMYEKRGKMVNLIIDKKTQTKEEKEIYEAAMEKVLNEAEIICCTLNSSGSDKLDRYYHNIEAIIVDEAAQCTEPSNIIPLRFKANKLILIGDPKQLPATTFNEQNSATKYNRSLFEVCFFHLEILRLWITNRVSRYSVPNDA